MSRHQRDKGAAAEREVVTLLQRIYPDACRSCSKQAGRNGGGQCPDVDDTPFWVEVKRRHAIALLRWLEGAEREAARAGWPECHPERTPVVFLREDGGRHRPARWAVLLWADDFLGLLDGEQP